MSFRTLFLSLFVLYYPFGTFIFISHSAAVVVVAGSLLALSLLTSLRPLVSPQMWAIFAQRDVSFLWTLFFSSCDSGFWRVYVYDKSILVAAATGSIEGVTPCNYCHYNRLITVSFYYWTAVFIWMHEHRCFNQLTFVWHCKFYGSNG